MSIASRVESPMYLLRGVYVNRTMFDQLPAELRLKTLAYFTVHDLRNAQLVSRSWLEFFIANESAIYRHAAVVHGLAPDSEASLAEACSRGSIVAAESWKDLRTYNILYIDWQTFLTMSYH